MASSITLPISGVCAAAATVSQRALLGTKKMPSAAYSSPVFLEAFALGHQLSCFCSNLSEMYFRKMSPSTTFLYSDASMLPRSLSAAFQICCSKPISAVLSVFFFAMPTP